MKLKNLALSILVIIPAALSMGFTGPSQQDGLVVVYTGSVGSQCFLVSRPLARCPSGTVIVSGGCEFAQGKDAIATAAPDISFLENNASCNYTCNPGRGEDVVFVNSFAVCATVK